MRTVKGKLKDESGNMVLSLGALSLMLLFAMFAVNTAYYYSYQQKLNSIANSIAAHAGNYLPNPSLSAQAAVNAFELLKNDFVTGEPHFGTALELQVSFDYYEVGAGNVVTLSRTTLATPESSWPVALPIKSLTVKVSGRYTANLLNFNSTLGAALPSVQVIGQASTQLIPTDVVLVIENSNSIISPLADESASLSKAFSLWKDDFPGRGVSESEVPYGSTLEVSQSKARLRERQCFGKTAYEIKRAALQAFDYLSSVGTYRVGVIHTTDLIGEVPTATINITPDSYGRVYQRRRFSSYQAGAASDTPSTYNEVMYNPGANSSYGTFEYPETRCAALTAETAFRVPAHPFASYATLNNFASNSLKTNLAGELSCDGEVDTDNCPSAGHLTYDASGILIPRELIWIKNSGFDFETGLPNPLYDYTKLEFPILRAIDMLRTAPARADNLPVRRQIVLVFTDGWETPYLYETGVNLDGATQNMTFRRAPAIAEGSAEFSEKVYSLDYADSASNFDFYCATHADNLIQQSTQPDESSGFTPESNNLGIKLGVLVHGAKQTGYGATLKDPSFRLLALRGHGNKDKNDLGTFRSECNTRWTEGRGRFFMEMTSPVLGEDAMSASQMYYEQITPQALRSFFDSELIQTNAD